MALHRQSLFFWGIVLCFLFGTATQALLASGWSLVWLLCFIAILVLGTTPLMKLRFYVVLIAVCLLAAAGGAVRMQYAIDTLSDATLARSLNSDVSIEGMVMAEPDERESSTRLYIDADTMHIGTEEYAIDAGVLAVVSRHSDIAFNDRVLVSGYLEMPDSFETETGRVFDYPGYLAKSGIAYQVSFPHVERIAEAGGSVRGALFELKHAYVQGLAFSLPEPHAALAGGITVGDKQSLGDTLLSEFRETGIVHIVVLSGYNVTIIAESIMRSLAWLPQSWGLGVGGVAIILFALLTGASATTTRASVMALIALMARATGRSYAMTRALALAAVGMVLWEPHILMYDPGFQLSIAATLGLIHVAPLIEARMLFITERFGLRSIVGATLATQFTVLPLLLYQSGSLSLVALPVNMLVLSIMPVTMLLVFISGIAGMVFGAGSVFIAAPAYALLAYILWIVDMFAKTPFAAVTVPVFPFVFVVIAYAALTWGIIRLNRQETKKIPPRVSGRREMRAV